MAVEHSDEELEPDRFPEAEAQHRDGVRDLLVAVGHVAQAIQQLQRQNPRLAVSCKALAFDLKLCSALRSATLK